MKSTVIALFLLAWSFSVSAQRAPSKPVQEVLRGHVVAPVIFQHVVPLPGLHEHRRRRSGAKVQIGCKDLQGADLSRRLLHGSMP
ncbi:MAG TPA: hypothetical protein VGN39_16775, partial [Terriglobales bacterium]|nr:hypothetical protein [Terriglobales bacterium]